MNGPDGLRQENAALRGRISALSAAILRISASLDLDTVLREVVDSACALTGARYGMIATVDEAGAIQEFIAPGLSAEERRHMAEWPPGHRFFEHLRDLPGALRLADVPAYLRSLGYAEELTLSKTLQAMPMRHRGVHVGNFFLGEKEGGARVHGGGRGGPGAVRLAGGDGGRQRAHAPRRAAGPGRPGGPGRHLAGRGGGVRCPDRPPGVVQPRGAADRRGAVQSGQPAGATAGRHDLPARRRARGPARRAPARRRVPRCRDGARGGDRALGPGRAQRHHAGQRDADPFGGRRGRVGGGHPAGPRAARGARPSAGRVPGHGGP